MVVEIALIIIAVYLSLGAIFVIPFLIRGITKVDAAAHGSTTGFKLIIVPGVIVFWPVLLSKWRKANRNSRQAHK